MMTTYGNSILSFLQLYNSFFPLQQGCITAWIVLLAPIGGVVYVLGCCCLWPWIVRHCRRNNNNKHRSLQQILLQRLQHGLAQWQVVYRTTNDPPSVAASSSCATALLDDDSSSTCCIICMESFVDGDVVLQPPTCSHVFHMACSLQWFATTTTACTTTTNNTTTSTTSDDDNTLHLRCPLCQVEWTTTTTTTTATRDASTRRRRTTTIMEEDSGSTTQPMVLDPGVLRQRRLHYQHQQDPPSTSTPR